MRSQHLLTLGLCATFTLSASTYAGSKGTQNKVWTIEGLHQPESVVVHPTKDLLFVSNINGTPVEKNGKGYISLIDTSGKLIEQHWVDGLDAPKGMALAGDYLYVADMQTLHIINHKEGKLVNSISHPKSVMLNDITADNKGNIYISDLLGGGVYHYSTQSKHLTQWISPEVFPHPNGLFFAAESVLGGNKGQLLLATWGEGLQADFTTNVPGGLYSINPNDKSIRPFKNAQSFGNLDGLTQDGDSLVISDWLTGNIFRYNNQVVKNLFNAEKSAADITSKNGYLYVPVMFSNKLDVYNIQ